MKFIIQTLIFLYLIPGNQAYSQNSSETPSILYVNLGMETKKNISVKDFDSAFSKKDYKIWEAETNEEADSLDIYFKQFVRIRNQEVNIRVKIEYYIKSNSILIYMSNSGIFTEGFYYFRNDNLYHFLKKKLNALPDKN